MSEKIQAFIGRRFGKLQVESFLEKDSVSRNYFVCVCTCGNRRTVQQSNLLSGRSTSCGCSRRSFPTPSVIHDEQSVQKSSGVYVENNNGYIDVMSLPVMSREQLLKLTDDEKNEYWQKNPFFRFEPILVKKGDRVVLKVDGASGTSNSNAVRNGKCFDVTLDGGKIVTLSSINEVWKLEHRKCDEEEIVIDITDNTSISNEYNN